MAEKLRRVRKTRRNGGKNPASGMRGFQNRSNYTRAAPRHNLFPPRIQRLRHSCGSWHAHCKRTWHAAGNISRRFPNKKTKPETSRVPRGFPLMNSKKILALSAIVLGGVLSSSAFATTASSHASVAKAVAFEAPVLEKMVSPTGLSRRHEGSTVTLSM